MLLLLLFAVYVYFCILQILLSFDMNIDIAADMVLMNEWIH